MDEQHNLKEEYGFVETPSELLERLSDLIPRWVFEKEDYLWLDPGCGKGAIAKNIIEKRVDYLGKNKEELIKKNMFMVECNDFFIPTLQNLFGEDANIICEDFINYNPDFQFNVIISNPPYNHGGLKSIPQKKRTKSKWNPLWQNFLNKALDLLADNGFLCAIVPASWLKHDDANMYSTLTQYKIHKLLCLNSYEIYNAFNKQVQIPCTLFLLQKRPTDFIIPIYDEVTKSYMQYKMLTPLYPIPMKNIGILNRLSFYARKYGDLSKFLLISPLPSRKFDFKDEYSSDFYYSNIHSCVLENGIPIYKYKWSNKPGPFYYLGLPKLIMAHSVYGFPLFDKTGTYGISSRGKIIFMGKYDFLTNIHKILSLKPIMYLYSSTQYRMRFLDSSIFNLLPDFTKIPNFDFNLLNDEYFYEFFDFSREEINSIKNKKLFKIIAS